MVRRVQRAISSVSVNFHQVVAK
jgi:hypothetical protein